MSTFLLPFLSPFVLGTGLYFVESLWVSATRRWALFLLITASSQWAICYSPYPSPILNFITGLGSAWYVIWSADLLFVLDPRSFQRIREPAVTENDKRQHYYWLPLPGRFTLQRALWVLDLVTNPREIGWQHGLHVEDIPDSSQDLEDKKVLTHRSPTYTRRQFCVRHIGTAVCAHIFMALYEKSPFNARHWLAKYMPTYLQQEIWEGVGLWAWIIYIYCLLTLYHSIMALIAVGVFGHKWLGIAGLPWMYPPIFGPTDCFFTNWEIRCSIIPRPSTRNDDLLILHLAFWSHWWHNLLRRSLLSVPRKIIPVCTRSRRLQRLLYGAGSFFLSGYFHAAACYAVRQDPWSAGHVFIFFCLQTIPIGMQGMLSMLPRHSRLQEAVVHCLIALIGICWIFWTFPVVFYTPAILHVRETFHVPWNIWSPAFSYLNAQIGLKLLL